MSVIVRPRASRALIHLMVVLGVIALGACSDDSQPVDTTPPVEALSPVEAVARLLSAVQDGRFDDAATLTDTTQAALLTLVEGADVSEVAEALGDGGDGVAANFWSGFAQTLPADFSADSVELSSGAEIVSGEQTFVRVTVTQASGETQDFVLRDDDRWRIDLMATFAPVLAARMIPTVDNVLESANPNAALVLDRLQSTAPSLRIASDAQNLTAETRQSLLALLERITRAGP